MSDIDLRVEVDPFTRKQQPGSKSIDRNPKQSWFSANSNSAFYRPEIDGLRAVAIVLILLFHAHLGFPGGYIGVDVFFVISGYLITGLIQKDVSAGKFHFIEFWERRARRIFPAMMVMLLTTIAIAMFTLFPADLASFGKSLCWQSLFVSNFYFCNIFTFYFAPASETQPLLHTWSLAVEEQFYVVLPLLLMLIHLVRPRRVFSVLSLIVFLSLGFSAAYIKSKPMGTFFLLPSRAWELLLGSLLTVMPRQPLRYKIVLEFIGWAGFSAILAGSLLLDSHSTFPGIAALVPCLGAAAVIWSNPSELNTVGKILASRPIVFIGLISYSLYLWHWPFLAFATYTHIEPISISCRMGLLALSFLAAVLSYRFIETPFRTRTLLPTRRPLFACAAIIICVLAIGGRRLGRSEGMRFRFSPEVLAYIDGQEDTGMRVQVTPIQAGRGDLPSFGVPNPTLPITVLLWGDSHAMAVESLIDTLCKENGIRGVAATHFQTAPVLQYKSDGLESLQGESIRFNDSVVAYVALHHVSDVIVAARWSDYGLAPGSTTSVEFTRLLKQTVNTLHDCGARVWILRDVPVQPFVNPPKTLALALLHGQNSSRLGTPIAEHMNNSATEKLALDTLVGPGLTVLDPTPLLTDENGFCRMGFQGKSLYFDSNHLTTWGASQLRPLLQSVFKT